MAWNREMCLCGLLMVLFLIGDTESFGLDATGFPLSLETGPILGGATGPTEALEAGVSSVLPVADGLDDEEEETDNRICYENLGCFYLGKPWTSFMRPLSTPWSPYEILASATLYTSLENGSNIPKRRLGKIKMLQSSLEASLPPNSPKISFVLFYKNVTTEKGREKPEGYRQSFNTSFYLGGSDFNAGRIKTVFITHGFASNGDSSWLHQLKNAYLSNEDANVFIVDWGKGSSLMNYLQVASNTRIVGAQLARYIRYLMLNGLRTERLHLIGHSLGAHIMSYAAKNVSEISKVKRITALDPAQPAFEGLSRLVRLDRSDAEDIDVHHTDAKPFIPLLGFGMMSPVGSVNFYYNGGSLQPGCLEVKTPNITSITDLLHFPVEVVSEWVSCSHGRSYEYFTAALELQYCHFWGRKMSDVENFIKISTLGRLTFADPLVYGQSSCTMDTCNFVGLHTFKLPARGSFAVTTKPEFPFCETSEDDGRRLKNLLTLGLYDQAPSAGKILVDPLSFN